MSIIVENCGHFHTRKIPVLYHKHPILNKKDSKKYSYTSGISDEPLLGLTIGEAFEETVSRFPKNRRLSSLNIRIFAIPTSNKLEIEESIKVKHFSD
jgi:hypothetical protein